MNSVIPRVRSAQREACLAWLLEPDEPAVRAMALRDLVGLPDDAPELIAARRQAHQSAPITTVLEAMHPEGWWEKPGPGYGPKYRSSVWALILLAQVGAHVDEDPRVARACSYILDHALAPQGQLAYNGAPGGTFDCLQGNLCWALLTMGYADARLGKAFDWLARSVTGDGVAPREEKHAPLRYFGYKCGPGFACGANNGMPCAWGATKIALALGALAARARAGRPVEVDGGLVARAVAQTVDFLLVDGFMTAPWPSSSYAGGTQPPNRDWWLNGFPIFYISDLLQTAEALGGLGAGADPRLDPYLDWLETQQDARGRWPLRYTYGPKTWGDFGRRGQPNKWVTLRALRVLQAAGR